MRDLTSYYNSLYTCDVTTIPLDKDLPTDIPSPFNHEEVEQLFPIDPSTGQISDILSQILSTDNPLLRDSLMSRLEMVDPGSPGLSKVDDNTKLSLLKPRNCQSLSEMASYAEVVSHALEQLNVAQVPSSDSQPKVDPQPNADPHPNAD
ncbi:hypothetical protein [Microvirus sp.]|nr:hypothetical protein [Microvirus sp.]